MLKDILYSSLFIQVQIITEEEELPHFIFHILRLNSALSVSLPRFSFALQDKSRTGLYITLNLREFIIIKRCYLKYIFA